MSEVDAKRQLHHARRSDAHEFGMLHNPDHQCQRISQQSRDYWSRHMSTLDLVAFWTSTCMGLRFTGAFTGLIAQSATRHIQAN